MIFLSETKKKIVGMKKIKLKLGFVNGIYVQRQGKGGGLALFWKREFNLEIKSYSKFHIDAIVTEEGSGFSWRLTSFYSHPETHRRRESWRFLNTLNNQFRLPWLYFGDFNEILSQEEKSGGALRPQYQIEAFRDIVSKCEFIDLDFSGFNFTWCNQREGYDRVYLRLDRAFATQDWLEHFPRVRVQHLEDTTSDHCPILLTDSNSTHGRGKRRFFFEAIWAKWPDCKELVDAVSRANVNLHDPSSFSSGLKICASSLSKWGMSVFGQIPRKLKEMQDSLSVLTKEDTAGQNGAEINRIRKEINILLDDEELWWQQRSRVQWLGEGDRNTKYFHHRASERRRKNTITGLWNQKDVWCESRESIIKTAVDYFEDIYASSHPTHVEEVTDLILTKVTAEMNTALTQEFTGKDVKAALGQMYPTKAPGSDSMSALFYQKYWDIVGCDVANMVLNVLNSNASIANINNTYITLVPKVKMPNRMKDFRPISLCNTAYKLLSKVLANCLKTVLPRIIFENQSAFLSERLITDSVLVAFELMHYLEHKKSGDNGYMAVKLDMSKAYNRVEWVFIEKVMRRLGFNEKWIGWVMKCITLVSYSILINGEAHGNISPSRGLR